MSRVKTYLLANFPKIANLITLLRGNRFPIFLEYEIRPFPRYGYGTPAHPRLYNIIDSGRDKYASYLQSFLAYKDHFLEISVHQKTKTAPFWINGFLPGLDSVALYSFIVNDNPKLYIEIGSGNSTKFARKAINDHSLRTRIVSIDPVPRSEIDELCDEMIREPLEDVELALFDELDSGDILFIDNSHRSFPNSDVTTVFLDILPRLKAGVTVHIHDIFLPNDYPPLYCQRWYSEQYLLACYLLAEGGKFDICLPNAFISDDNELSNILSPLWANTELDVVERHGVSFWIQIK